MTKVVLLCSIALASAGAWGLHRTAGPTRPAPIAPADSSRVTLTLRGMTCGSCAKTAQLALQRTAGVYHAEVSYDSAKAVVLYDSERTSPEQFVADLKE